MTIDGTVSLLRPARPGARSRQAVLGLTAVHLAAHALDVEWLVAVTKPLLVPGLALAFAQSVRGSSPQLPGTAKWVLAALGASTVGDVALMLPGTSAWLAGMGSFLVAQGCYVRAFVELGALKSLRRNPLPAVMYGVAWAVANLALGPQLDGLRWPVLAYSGALCAMGATSAALGGRIGIGGAVFVVSDLLIGLGITGVEGRALDVAVMATYVAAQYLLTTGAAERLRRAPVVPSAVRAAQPG